MMSLNRRISNASRNTKPKCAIMKDMKLSKGGDVVALDKIF